MSDKIVRKGAFQKGNKAAVGGRRLKGAQNIAKQIREETNNGEEIVDFVMRVFRGKHPAFQHSPADLKWAAEWLADRAYDTARQIIELNTEQEQQNILPDMSGLTDEELKVLEEAGNIMNKAKGIIDV